MAVDPVRGRLTAVDVAVHLAVAGALVVAYLRRPYEWFLFRPGESGVIDAYRSILGHADPGHLLANAVGFLVLGGLSVALLAGVSRRSLYYACFGSILALVPPLSALAWTLSAAGSPARAGAGFSIVTAAFAGLLAVAVSIHGGERLSRSPSPVASSVGLAALAASVGTAAAGGPPAPAAGAGAVALAALYRLGRAASATLARPGGAVAVSLLAVGLSAFVGATVDLLAVGTAGAVRPHAVGLGLGFVVCWLAWWVERLAARADPAADGADPLERSP